MERQESALQVIEHEPRHLPVERAGGALTAGQMRDRVNLVQQVMKSVMKPGTHFDTIPGTDKPALLKPGAEVLCMTFRIADEYQTEDLSSGDEIRYRITCVGVHQETGLRLGQGLGECSSLEEKYKWRRVVCDEEFDATSEERRRIKYARGKGGTHYTIKQIRTEPADVANTVLKMGAKRAKVAMTLNVTAASDMFMQDLEELDPELRDSLIEGEHKPTAKEPKAKAPPKSGEAPPGPTAPGAINATQLRILKKKLTNPEVESWFCKDFGIATVEELPAAKINEALAWSPAVQE